MQNPRRSLPLVVDFSATHSPGLVGNGDAARRLLLREVAGDLTGELRQLMLDAEALELRQNGGHVAKRIAMVVTMAPQWVAPRPNLLGLDPAICCAKVEV